MVEVKQRYPKEDVDSMLRRFKRLVERDGILAEYRKREYFVSPSRKRHEMNCKMKFRQKLARRKNRRGY